LQPHNGPQTGLGEIDGGPAELPSHDTAGLVHQLEHDDTSHVPVYTSPGTGRKLISFAALLAAGLGAAFWYSHHRNAAAQDELARQTAEGAGGAAPVDVVRVGYASPTGTLTLPGVAAGWHQSIIYARVNGYINDWKADIGTRVNAGDVLATIDTPELDHRVNAAEAKVRADDAEIVVARAHEKFALSAQTMYEGAAREVPGSVSEYHKEEKQADHASAIAECGAALAKKNLDEAELAGLKSMQSFKTVTAPYKGVITARKIDIGDLVTAGSTASTTPLYQIADPDTIRVFVDVPQWASIDIKLHMPAAASSPEFPGRVFNGTVEYTSNAIDPVSKTLKVEVDIPNKDWTLLPGMYLEVSFQTTQVRPRLRIPAGALNFRSGGPQVAVVDPQGDTIHFRDVTIARDMGNYVEIGSGVSAGDLVALNVSNQISDGDKVSPNTETDSGGIPQPSEHDPAVAKQAG